MGYHVWYTFQYSSNDDTIITWIIEKITLNPFNIMRMQFTSLYYMTDSFMERLRVTRLEPKMEPLGFCKA
jgi:hypothetical protein